MYNIKYGLPWWPSGKESACSVGNTGSMPVSGRSPGGGHGNPLQYSYRENPRDRGAWWATIHAVTKSQTGLKWLSVHTLYVFCNFLFLIRHFICEVYPCWWKWKCWSRSRVQLFVTPWTVVPTRPRCPWDFPGKNTWVGSHSLLHGIIPTRDWTHVSCIADGFCTFWATSMPVFSTV